MGQIVTFDPLHLRIVEVSSSGDTSYDWQEIYSEWKDWILEDPTERMKHAPAFSVIGGEERGGGAPRLGSTYFIQNGWKWRPAEYSHHVTITGNIVTIPAGERPWVSTLGAYTAGIQLESSANVYTLAVGSGVLPADVTDIATAARNAILSDGTAFPGARIDAAISSVGGGTGTGITPEQAAILLELQAATEIQLAFYADMRRIVALAVQASSSRPTTSGACMEEKEPGETLLLRQAFTDDDGEPLVVPNARFYLKDPLGTEILIGGILDVGGTSAHVVYDLPIDAMHGTWRWCCVTGGDGTHYRASHVLEIVPKAFAAAVPAVGAEFHRVYYGVGVADIVTPMTLMAMTHLDLDSTHEFTFTVSPANQHVYVCVPTGWDVDIMSSGISLALKTTRTAQLAESNGNLATYDVCETTYAITWSLLSVSVLEAT